MKPRVTCHALAFILMCNTLPSFSQDAPHVESYAPCDFSLIPPSPGVSALMKHIDFPVYSAAGSLVSQSSEGAPFGRGNVTLGLDSLARGTCLVTSGGKRRFFP